MSVFEPSHAVAVTGYVYRGGRFLLLKRATPPLIWAPPGGRLHPWEDPLKGAIREILEETGLEVEPLALVDYWFGEIQDRGPLLSLDFVFSCESAGVVLSAEHLEFRWVTLAGLQRGNADLGTDSWCYRLEHFVAVESRIHSLLKRSRPDLTVDFRCH